MNAFSDRSWSRKKRRKMVKRTRGVTLSTGTKRWILVPALRDGETFENGWSFLPNGPYFSAKEAKTAKERILRNYRKEQEVDGFPKIVMVKVEEEVR